MDIFTHREKFVLIFVFIMTAVAAIVGQETLDDWELAGMIFVVLPIGIYIATDPERLERLRH